MPLARLFKKPRMFTVCIDEDELKIFDKWCEECKMSRAELARLGMRYYIWKFGPMDICQTDGNIKRRNMGKRTDWS